MAPSEVTAEMRHAVSWVCKYRDRYAAEGWEGIGERFRAPHESGNAYDKAVVKAVCRTRSVLEVRAASGKELRYIGSHAIRGELLVAAQLFSPCYHLASNGYIECSYQDYNAYVWHATELADIPAVQQQAENFFAEGRGHRCTSYA